MRILTYNVHFWVGTDERFDVARVAQVIEETDPDLAVLNEVHNPPTFSGHAASPLTWLAKRLGMEFVFGETITEITKSEQTGPFGNGFLSRYPILAHANHRLSSPEGEEPRALLEVRVLLPSGKPLTCYGVHLDHRSEELRLEQVGDLLLWTGRDRDRAHLLLGDFNALAPSDYGGGAQSGKEGSEPVEAPEEICERLRGSKVIPRLLRAGYVDAFAQHGEGSGQTFPSTDLLVRLDYVFASQPLEPALRTCHPYTQGETALTSDHLPVLAELDETIL